VVLEKDGDAQLDRTCEKRRSVRVKEERNFLPTIKIRKANSFGYVLRRTCFLKHVIEGKVEVTGRLGRRRKRLLDDLKERRRYRTLRGETLGSTLLITHFRGDYRPVVRRSKWWWLIIKWVLNEQDGGRGWDFMWFRGKNIGLCVNGYELSVQ